MVTGSQTEGRIKGIEFQEELKKRKKKEPELGLEPEGYAFDYDTGQFVPATAGQVAQREQLYADFPEIGPPGTPGKITPAQFMVNQQKQKDELSLLIQRIYPEKFPESITPDMTSSIYREVVNQAQANTEDFISDLLKRASSQDIEALLRSLGAAPEVIDQIFGVQQQEARLVQNIQAVFPGMNTDDFINFVENDFDRFSRDILVGGLTPEKQDLLQLIGYTPDQISEAFTPAPVEAPADEAPVAIWEHYRTGETITQAEKNRRYPKGWESGLDEWRLTREAAMQYPVVFKVFGEALTKLPKQLGAATLQAVFGTEGASAINKGWANALVKDASTDIDKFVQETSGVKTDLPFDLTELARLPQSMAFSLVSMAAGLGVGVPIGLIPVPFARVAAWSAGTAASGAVAFRMASYQIMQQYLEAMDADKKAETGQGLTIAEENALKAEFETKAKLYGLWEALPEAVSNLAFAKLLTAPLGQMVGRSIAGRIISKIAALYGEELLTETITQKGQSAIEVEAGLRQGNITWWEAFKEVAPQTFLLTTIMGGSGQVAVDSYNKIRNSLMKETGDSNLRTIILQKLQTIINDETGSIQLPGRKPVDARIAELEAEKQKLIGEGKNFEASKISDQIQALKETPAIPQAEAGMPEAVTPAITEVTAEKAANIRLEKYSEEVRPFITEWAETHQAEVQEARRGVISDEQVRVEAEKLVSEVGGDLDKFRKKWKPGTAWNAEELVAIRGVLKQKTSAVLFAQREARENNSTQNLLKLQVALKEQAAVQEIVHGLTAEAGRALRSFRQDALDVIQSNDIERMEALLKKIGGREGTEKIAQLLGQVDINDPVAVNNFIQSLSKPTLMDYLTEIFYNSILSGPKTHIVNSLSNTANALFSPVERFASALVDMPLAKIQGRQQDRYLNEIPADIFGAIRGIPEGFRQFAYVIKNGISFDQATKWEFRPKAFKGKKGAIIGMPSRFLEAADALMKTINQRAAINAISHRMASKENLQGQAFENRVAELLSTPTEEMLSEADKVAEYRLFRQPPGKFGQTLMNMRESVDIKGFKPLRFVIPFIRTPMNLVKFGLERTPLGFLNPKLWENVAQKNPEAADQIARATIGSIGLAALAWYFAAGMITGAPPRDRAERERFYREGKQPYAIRVGGFWISYQRLEPFNQLLGQVAILVEGIQNNDKGIDEKILDSTSTFGQNFVSQTYMSSLSDLIDMLSAPERYAGNWLNRFASSMLVPMSSATRTAAQMFDNVVRDPDNALETIEANIPGLSTRVKAKITALGEDIQRKSPQWFPINITPVEETVLSQELERMQFDIGFAGKTIAGIELSDDEQREYQTLSGQLIKSDLEKLMLAPEYWQASDVDKDKMLRKVVDAARDWSKVKIREKIWATGTTEDRMKVLETALRETDAQLGNVISETPTFTHEPPNIYDLGGELDASYRSLLGNIPEDSLKGIKTPPTVTSWYAKEKARITAGSIPDKPLININADKAKGTTFEEYYQQWQKRGQITDARELETFDKEYPNANLGNITRRQLDLLKEYNKYDKAGQEKFLAGLGESERNLLTANAYTGWLKANPKDNAQLAIWGQAKILTKEAYTEFNRLVKELDAVDSALPKLTLPPATSIDTHFQYEDMAADGKQGSWESQLMLKQDAEAARKSGVKSYADWRGLQLSDTPMASLELKTEKTYRKTYDAIKDLSDKDSTTYIPDEKARQKKTDELKSTKIGDLTYTDVERKIDAVEKGTDEKPVGDEIINAHVKFGQIIDQPDRGSSSAEAMLFRVDNPDYDEFRTDEIIWGKEALKPVDQPKIPIWRIDAQYRKEDAAYKAILDKYEGREENQETARMLADNAEYRIARRQRDFYKIDQPDKSDALRDKYTGLYELPDKGFRQERFLIDPANEDLYDILTNPAIMGDKVRSPIDPEDVPDVRYDEITEANQDLFDEWEGYGKGTSKLYIADADARESARAKLTMTKGNVVYSGVNFYGVKKLTNFGKAVYEREAYYNNVPKERVADYVAWKTIGAEGKPENWELKTETDLWYEDNWFMMEHSDFYKNVYIADLDKDGKPDHDRKDYRTVPTREVFNKYLTYLTLPQGTARKNFRFDNLDFDDWLVLKFPSYKSITEQKRRGELTPTERALEDVATQSQEWQSQLDEIEKILAGVG